MATISSVTKFFPVPQEGFITTTSGTTLSGAVTVGLNSVTGYTNGDTVCLVIEPTSTTNKQVFTGVVDTAGVQITGVIWTEGTNVTHTAGSTVVDYVTATHLAIVTKGLLVSHNPAGTMITSLPLTTPKITTSINDSGGNEVIKTPATASAVNEITVTNAATTVAPSISATGGDSTINLNLRGKGLAKTVTIGAGAAVIYPYDFVVSGCVISADSAGSNRNWSITAGVVVINGNPVTVALQSANTATASKDTYVDVLDNGDGTGLLVFTGGNIVNNNAASPALASNSVRLGVIVTGAGSIAAAASINQGQEDRILPIASSIPYAVTDSLGNLICPRDPQRRILGYRQILANVSTPSTTAVQATGLSCPVIVPTGRKVKISCYCYDLSTTGAAPGATRMSIWDGVVAAGTQLLQWDGATPSGAGYGSYLDVTVTPASASKTYNVGYFTVAAGTITLSCASTTPAYIKVELV